MKKVLNLISLNYKVYKKTIISWLIIITLIMFCYMILFPSLKEIGMAKLDALPKEFLDIMGIDSLTEITKYDSYFNMMYQIIIIVISCFVAYLSHLMFRNEEDKKTINYLSNLDINRMHIFISKYILSILIVIVTVISLILVSLLCGYINGKDSFHFIEVIKSGLITGFIPLLFISVSHLLVGISSKISSITPLFIVLIIYMLGYLGILLDNDILINLSPFNVFKIDSSNLLLSFFIYFIITDLLNSIGLYKYIERDLSV